MTLFLPPVLFMRLFSASDATSCDFETSDPQNRVTTVSYHVPNFEKVQHTDWRGSAHLVVYIRFGLVSDSQWIHKPLLLDIVDDPSLQWRLQLEWSLRQVPPVEMLEYASLSRLLSFSSSLLTNSPKILHEVNTSFGPLLSISHWYVLKFLWLWGERSSTA